VIRVATQRICDRCHKSYSEEEYEQGKPTPATARKPYTLSHGDHVVLAFQDLCDSCDPVVQGLIGRLRLDPVAKKPSPAPVATTDGNDANPIPTTV
jgi:hypothetical protein